MISVLCSVFVVIVIFFLVCYCHYGITSLQELKLELKILKASVHFILNQASLKYCNTTYIDVWKNSVSRYKKQPFLVDEAGTWTFGEVDDLSNSVAKYLHEKGVREKNTVAVVMTNSLELVVSWLAVVKLGAKPALINTNLKGASLLHCISLMENLALALVNPALEKHMRQYFNIGPNLSSKLPLITVDLQTDNQRNNMINLKTIKLMSLLPSMFESAAQCLPAKKRYDSIVGFIYTSGTTGYPKAVPISFHRIWSLLKVAIVRRYKIKKNDVMYIVLPMYHSTAFCVGLHTAILSGCKVILKQKLSVQSFWRDIKTYKVTVCLYVGEMCRFLLRRKDLHLPGVNYSLRLMIGNGLSADIYEEFKESFKIPTLAEFYSQTEGYGFLGSILEKPGSFGYVPKIRTGKLYPYRVIKCDTVTLQPLRNFTNGLCRLCDVNEPGLLVVNAANFPKANFSKSSKLPTYHDNVMINGDVFISTGDLISIAEDRSYRFVDRLGDTFRWKSENVSTVEVSSVMMGACGVEECCVYGVVVQGYGGRAGMAAIVVDGERFSFSFLYAQCDANLPKYAIPVFLRKVACLELTETFKYKTTTLQQLGYSLDAQGEVLIADHAQKTYVPLAEETVYQIENNNIRL